MSLFAVAVAQTRGGLTGAGLRAGRKSRSSSLGRGVSCPASTLSASSAAVTANAAQVFADGFVQRPPGKAGVYAPLSALSEVESQSSMATASSRLPSRTSERVRHSSDSRTCEPEQLAGRRRRGELCCKPALEYWRGQTPVRRASGEPP